VREWEAHPPGWVRQKKISSGRPPVRRVMTDELKQIYLQLVSAGDSDKKAARMTRIDHDTWDKHAKKETSILGSTGKTFGQLLEVARDQRCGGLGALIRSSMKKMIAKGHPWWTKLAIWNYNVGLVDPDRELVRLETKTKTYMLQQIDLFTSQFAAIVASECPPEQAAKIHQRMRNLVTLLTEPTRHARTDDRGSNPSDVVKYRKAGLGPPDQPQVPPYIQPPGAGLGAPPDLGSGGGAEYEPGDTGAAGLENED
jgi:hypothetical protein